MKWIKLLLLAIAVTLSACAPVAEPAQSNNESGLANTQWRLVSFGAPGTETPVVEGSTITLEFEAGNQAVGSGGCNSYGGEYQVQDGTLSFGNIISTERACVDASMMQQEQQYFQALQSAGQFELTDDQLTIQYDGGQGVLNFVRASDSTDSADVASPTPVGSSASAEAPAAELQAMLEAELPSTPTPDASGYSGPSIEGVEVISLTNTTGDRPLWAAYSFGMRSFEPLQNHFVAIYSHNEAGWQELGRQELEDVDYLDQNGVEQVRLEPDHVWLRVEGGAGAHGGVFTLLQFDGQTLEAAVSHFSASPGGSRLEDLNDDEMLEVLLDQTEYYVFCYACGVRFVQYQVLHWDGGELSEVSLTSLPESAPAELRELNNQAVALAQARLLQEAETMIEQAQALDEESPIVTWNAALINLLLNEQSEQAQGGPYPLLESIFYGNYEASLEVMRSYQPEEIFSQPTPLISGSVAESWEQAVSEWILRLTNGAIEVEPELAAAYFLRGWARFLENPASPDVLADVRRAAELEPQNTLFSESVEYLEQIN